MWGLWLAVMLAAASAAPQEVIEEIESDFTENTSDTTVRTSLGEEATPLSYIIGTEVTNIFNDTKYKAHATTENIVVSDNNEQQNEQTTAANLESTVETNIDNTKIDVDLNNQSTGIDYSEELYLPDEVPIDNTIDDTLGSDDIFDVINNFIGEKDPMLQLFLSICFIHPTCYQLDSSTNILSPHSMSSISPLSQELARHLSARRTETARTLLVDAVMQVQKKIKSLMFKYIKEGVGARGVSVLATKTIIDSIKSIWLSVNDDLESAKSSIQELFYLLPLDTMEQVQAMVEIAEVVQRIPDKTEELLQEATQEGYQQYVRDSSCDSWKRKGVK